MTAATSRSPAAGCPMAPTHGRCARCTGPGPQRLQTRRQGSADMKRQLLSFCLALPLLTLWLANAGAVELPVRKAGLWEMKVVRAGSPVPDVTMQHCTDETTDKTMNDTVSPMKDMCSKQDIQKTATGYVSDSVCGVAGMSITSHAEITGDFNSGYTVKSTSHSERGPGG